MKRLRALWQSLFGDADRRVRMARVLGLLFITAGFVVIYKAWDGAANINLRIDSQFPYLLSGGFMGLGLIITGATLLLLATVRSERKDLTDRFEQMATLLTRNLTRLQFSSNGSSGSSDQVIAGGSTYHRVGCRVLEGKDGLMTVTVDQASAEGLFPCRVCDPPVSERSEKVEEDTTTSTP